MFVDTQTLKALCCQVGKFFQLEERKSCFTQEVRAGTVTFLTVWPPSCPCTSAAPVSWVSAC